MGKVWVTSVVALALGAGSALAQDFGTAEEAQAMLEVAVAAIDADEAAALAAFTAGESPFRDRDLYVFCGGADGILSAHGANAALIGEDMRALVDTNGFAFGEAFFATAVAGEYRTVEYHWPRPGETKPAAKVSYVTMAGDQMCGVGYYP
jgi:signal transduction histidine kinase